MKANKYKAICKTCNGFVRPFAGILSKTGNKWLVEHLACNKTGNAQVNTITFSSGESITRNKNGLCIDAPCCGCCTG